MIGPRFILWQDNELQGHWELPSAQEPEILEAMVWPPQRPDLHVSSNIHVDGMSLPAHADSELLIVSCSSGVELQDYSVLRALVRFCIIRFHFSVLFYIFGESQRRLFQEVIPLKLL